MKLDSKLLSSFRRLRVAAFVVATAISIAACGSGSGPDGSITEELKFKSAVAGKVVLTALGPGTFKVVAQELRLGNGSFNFTSCAGTEQKLKKNEAATCEASVTPSPFEAGNTRQFVTKFKVDSYPEKAAPTWLRQE
jgi:hypothetical protein